MEKLRQLNLKTRMSLLSSYDESDSFVDYQTRMVGVAKEIARLATDMTAKAATEPGRLVELGNEMCGKYEQLAQDSVGASATTPSGDVANRIRSAVVELGESISELIKAGGHCRLSAIAQNQRAVADSAKLVNERVVSVLSGLQAGSRGTQACIHAAATISAIIGDLDTTILFASAGTLQSDKESDTFSDHRENILKTAKALVEDTKTLVGGAAGTQEQLADAAQNAVTTIVQLCEVVKLGAMSLGSGSPEPQVLVAAATHSLVEAANALVQGAATEERLISSARQVASSTAHLLVACKVKADPGAESTRRLQAAGAEVIRSTDNLVRAARDAIHCDDERSLVLNRRMVGGIAQEIDARSEVLRIEKELEEARGRLTAIRQAKYKLRSDADDSDADPQPGYGSDSSGPQRVRTPNSSFANTTYSPNSSQQTTLHQSSLLQTTHSSGLNSTSYGQQNSSSPAPPQPTSPTFSSFRPAPDAPKQNYEAFTTRTSTNDRTMNNYETRMYDTPRPVAEHSTTERQETSQYRYKQEKLDYEAPRTPLSPKFNARELKFDEHPEPIYSTLKKPSDGLGQTFSEHQRSTESIPGGTKHSEYTIKSESYQSFPKTEFSKTEFKQEVKSPFTSTPKFDRTSYVTTSSDLVKAATPDYERMASPYAKEGESYGGPNYMEETTTEVKEIPNGTQKITTTKIYSSSPVNLTSTSTKYEPIKLDGIDEISKTFDSDSRYSTLDSRFNTLESKLSSDTSRSFMRPSEFQSSDYQTTSNVTKVKKPDLSKEIDSLDKRISKQTITSETIERKSVMTSSHKSETSSTVTKKFGNF